MERPTSVEAMGIRQSWRFLEDLYFDASPPENTTSSILPVDL